MQKLQPIVDILLENQPIGKHLSIKINYVWIHSAESSR